VLVPVVATTAPRRPEATPSVAAAAPSSPAAGDGVPASPLLASGRVDEALVALAGMTADDGAFQPRVTRSAGPWRGDCSLVIEGRACTTQPSTVSAELAKYNQNSVALFRNRQLTP